jgi:2-keto-3-deoxy-6-phosphogluconate aldolase
MEKREALNRMIHEGLIPVIRVSTANEAMDVADAVRKVG